MQPESTFLSLVPVLVQAGCFTGGERWGTDKFEAFNAAAKFCMNKGADTYVPGGFWTTCHTLTSGKHVTFVTKLRTDVQSDTKDLTLGECYDGLSKEINLCDHGGSTSYTNWEYTWVIQFLGPLLERSS